MTFLPNLSNKLLPESEYSAAQMYLFSGELCGAYGYVLGPKITHSTRSLIVTMLFPYGQFMFSNNYKLLTTETSISRLYETNKLPFTKFTQFHTDEPLIDPLYEDFIVMTNVKTILETINLLKKNYKHMHTLLVTDEAGAKYKMTKESKLTLLMARGEDVYPNEVQSEDSIALLLHDGSIPLFYITFSNNFYMFSCDSIVKPEERYSISSIRKHLDIYNKYIELYKDGKQQPDKVYFKLQGNDSSYSELNDYNFAVKDAKFKQEYINPLIKNKVPAVIKVKVPGGYKLQWDNDADYLDVMEVQEVNPAYNIPAPKIIEEE